MTYCCARFLGQNAQADRFVLLAARPVGEKDERASDCASFWTHFYFTGWGKHDLHKDDLLGLSTGGGRWSR